ncbi:MAG: hypothetical protein K2Z81_11425 [Cyanobacteria bacterium]|nr:hypothetical protein [Cyanobacteriota bacterium]
MKTTNLIICSVIALFLLSSSGEIQSASALESNKKVICYGLLSHSSMGEFDSKKNTIVPCEIQPTFSTGEYAGVTLIGNGHTAP